MTDDGTSPFGGKLSHSSMEWTDDSTEVEISQGQKPTSFFNVPNLDGAFEFLRAAPNSSKWLYTTEGSKSTHGIYTFDAAQPESGASVIGLGGIGVMSLQTHKVRHLLPRRGFYLRLFCVGGSRILCRGRNGQRCQDI